MSESEPTKLHVVLAVLAFGVLFLVVALIGSRTENGCAAHQHQHGGKCEH